MTDQRRSVSDSPAPSTALPEAVLFDHDGTLVDTEPVWARAKEEVAAEFDAVWTEQDTLACLGQPMSMTVDRLRELGVRLTPEEIVRRLAATGAVAGLCPITESSLGDGIFNGANDDGSGTVSVIELAKAFGAEATAGKGEGDSRIPEGVVRKTDTLTHPNFSMIHSETQLMRYLRKLADKDLALDRSMIPLGSCTMKLNATAKMIPVTWAEFGQLLPFVPLDQAAGTLIIEPTKSEAKYELDRLINAMVSIRQEIAKVESGEWDATDNPLHNAPHTLADICDSDWNRSYDRMLAAYPAPEVHRNKFWPTVNRIDDVYGDRNLICTCPPVEAYAQAAE